MKGICIVGYGYWGPKLVRNFLQAAAGCTVAVCDESPDRLSRAQKDFPAVKVFSSFDRLLADPDFDAVALATPVSTHFPLAKRALEAGRHVLVEKPLTTSRREADELIALASRQKRVLMVDHTFLYHPAVRKIKALVEAGDLGQLRYIDSTRINLGLFQHDVNVLWDLAVHDLSIVNYLTPERPLAVSAVATAHTAGAPENIGFLVLRYASGLVVHLNCSWVSPVKIRSSARMHRESRVWPGVCSAFSFRSPTIRISPSSSLRSTKGAGLRRWATTGASSRLPSCRAAEKWSAWVWVSIT